MLRPTVILLLLSAVAVVSQPLERRLSQIVTYVTGVITNYTARHRLASVDCWFYTNYPDPQPDSLLGSIQQHPALRQTPRVVLKRLLAGMISFRRPTFLVMDLRYGQSRTWPERLLVHHFPKDVRIFVFIDGQPFPLRSWSDMFTGAGLLNVFFIRTDSSVSFYGSSFVGWFIGFEEFPLIPFPDHARDLHGRKLQVSHFTNNMDSSRVGAKWFKGPAIEWLRATLKYINATVKITASECNSNAECEQLRVKSPDGFAYDFGLDKQHLYHGLHMTEWTVESLAPSARCLVAPRSPPMAIHELFVAPFQKEVWITVMLLLIMCVLLGELFPNQFHNNLALLTLCSFERTALHRVQRLEKTFAMALIIFFFVLLSAYESLFISLMTNRPRLQNARSMEDLAKAGIKLVHGSGYLEEELQPFIANDSSLIGLEWDGRNAYLVPQDYLPVSLRQPDVFDYETGESRYVVVGECWWKGFSFFVFEYGSPVVEKFRHTHTALHEAGIWASQKDGMEAGYLGGYAKLFRTRWFQAAGVMLGIAHLMPAWVVLALGWSLSLTALMIEWGWLRVHQMCCRTLSTVTKHSVRYLHRTNKKM